MRGGENHSRSTNAALCTAAFQKRFLQDAELCACCYALYSENACSMCRKDGNETPVYECAIHQNRTGPTFALATSFLHARQSKAMRQYVQQAFNWKCEGSSPLAVHNERDFGAICCVREQIAGGTGHRTSLATPDARSTDCDAIASKISYGSRGIELKRICKASSTALRIAAAGPSIGSSPIPLPPKAPCTLPNSSKNTRMGCR